MLLLEFLWNFLGWVVNTTVSSITITILWNWFAAPLGVPELKIVQTFALILIILLINPSGFSKIYNKQRKVKIQNILSLSEEEKSEIKKLLREDRGLSIIPLIYLAIGWVLHFLM